MRIEIEIPKEFECDYNGDKFKNFFSRVLCDITEGKCLCGNYEIETAKMFIKAFDESKAAYDVEKVVAELENETDCPNCSMYCADAPVCGFDTMCKRAVDIVRNGEKE